MRYSKWFAYLILIVLLCCVPLVMTNSYFLYMAIIIGIYIIVAAGLNVIVGYAGQMSFCHAAFFGIGAYTTAILSTRLGLNFWLNLPLSMIAAGLLAFIIGYPSLRLRGPYFAIATVGCGEVVRSVLHNWVDLTQGSMGISNIPPPNPIVIGNLFTLTFDTRQNYYYLVLFFMLLTLFIISRIIKSKAGRAYEAIRIDDVFARSIGINVHGYKMQAFLISALFGGLAGALYSHCILFISPVSFTTAESTNMVLMVIMGGKGTLIGPIVGAFLLMILPEALRFLADYRMALYGLLLMLVMIFMPNGLVGVAGSLRALYRKKSVTSEKGVSHGHN